MANLILGFPNQDDKCTLSGGSYSASLPLSNVLDRRISKVARTTGLGVARASTATYYNQAGILSTAAANVVRVSFDPSDLSIDGQVLTEESSTNYFNYSEDLTAAFWSKSRVTITANAVTAPDGVVSADKLVEDTTASNTHLFGRSISWVAGTTYTVSVFAKIAERTRFKIDLPAAAFSATQSVIFDLSTGSIYSVSSGTTATIKSVGNGWYRCTFTGTATLTASGSLNFLLITGTTTTVYTGDGASGLYLWGLQFETQSVATSYIPTTSATATRAADVLASSFNIALDRTRANNIFAIIGHNMTNTAKMRVRGNTSSDFTTSEYDSGWYDVWSDVADTAYGTLEWESDSFWSWKLTNEEAAYYPGLAMNIFPYTLTYQYWRVEFYDPDNTEGFVDMGRLFIGTTWEVTNNASFGWGLGYEDSTVIEEALGGAEYYDERPKYRVMRFSLDWITESEALTAALGASRILGVSGEMLFVWDRDDADNLMRRSFLGRLRTLNPIENPDPIRYTTAYEIKEIIA